MGYLALFVLAVFGHTVSAKSWGGYNYHRPMGNHHHPTENYHNFNYNSWCHSPGWWDGNHSWEDNNSNERPEGNGDRSKPFRAGSWDRSDSWEDSSSEENQQWDDYNNRPIRAGGWDSSESSEDSCSEESQEWNDGKDRLIRSTTKRNVVINKTQTEDTSSISTRQTSTGSTASPLEVLWCLRMCPITSEYNPVCGTDDITYRNPGRLQCARSCGINVAIKSPSACPSENLDTTDPPSSATTSLSPQVLATCMRSCSVTSEYNPVCGTDYITYTNPSRLECAKGCGKRVSILLPSRCPPPDQLISTTTTTTITTPTTLSPQVVAMCMRSCPVTPEYNPVCGTDNITYNNPSRLECARDCGKPVSVLLPSRCPSPDQWASTTTTTSSPATISSITPTRPNPGPTSTAEPTTMFTIAQNILDEIFNGNNSTTEPVPDFSFDERYE